MPRTIYISITKNPGGKPAHWALFIPTTNTPLSGKILHATGNTSTGFFLEFKRNFDFNTELRTYKLLPLAEVEDRLVRDTPGHEEEDTTARDRLESLATTVECPKGDVNPFNPEARNCQNWLMDFVDRLSEEGYVAHEARAVLQKAPKIL